MEFGYRIWTWPGMVTQSPFLKCINKNRFPDPDKRFLVSQKGIFFIEYIILRKSELTFYSEYIPRAADFQLKNIDEEMRN